MEAATAAFKSNRKRKTRNESKLTNQNDPYSHISFIKRSSSGRPGSPHRYFDDSFAAVTCCSVEAASSSDTKQSAADSPRKSTDATQIVHRHLNGLCIVTAGDILKSFTSSDDANHVSVSSVKYHVNASTGAQSARGKIRARKKKVKVDNDAFKSLKDGRDVDQDGNVNTNECHDGNVHPKDALCTITMSNGVKVEFKCCVSGTVLELNPRLVAVDSSTTTAESDNGVHSKSSVADSDSIDWKDGQGEITNAVQTKRKVGPHSCAPADTSLVLSDPLLDGYLAVILPKGPFPPKCSVLT